jgi:hypothetical protein
LTKIDSMGIFWNQNFILKVIVMATFIHHFFLKGTISTNMKNYVAVIGIDVSKLRIDAHMHHRSLHHVFSNPSKDYKALLLWTQRYLKEQCNFLCFENTGHYSTNLNVYFTEHHADSVQEI